MKLSQVRIVGFQSFRDSAEIEFSAGINLIVGQNNSGKSSLLRALQPTLQDDRNRSETQWETHALPHPTVTLSVDINGSEYKKVLLRYTQNIVPAPSDENISSYLENLFSMQLGEVSNFKTGRIISSCYFSEKWPHI